MPKTLAPLLSLQVRGQIGRQVIFCKRPEQQLARRWAKTPNPNTAAQVTTRTAFRFASDVWRTVPLSFDDLWKATVGRKAKTARNAFLGQFISDNRGASDLDALTFSNGARGGILPSSVNVRETAGFIEIEVNPSDLPIGWTLIRNWAATLIDQDPSTGTDFELRSASSPGFNIHILFTPNVSGTTYQCGGWMEWTNNRGQTVFGPSITKQFLFP